jgi:dipeptidase E
MPMGRIVAIAGGDLKTTHKINQYIVALTKKENPELLFIGTASCDA